MAIDLSFEELGSPAISPPPPVVLKKAKTILFSHLNRSTTTFRILSLEEMPPGGENVRENWIFSLDIATLSDHHHWAVVHRLKKTTTYNYGFN